VASTSVNTRVAISSVSAQFLDSDPKADLVEYCGGGGAAPCSATISPPSVTQVRWATGVGGFATKSGLGFNPITTTQTAVPVGELFPIGTLTHYNLVVNGIIPAYVHLQVSLAVDSVRPPPFKFRFTVDETDNQGKLSDCDYPSVVVCADRIGFDSFSFINNQQAAGSVKFNLPGSNIDFTLAVGGFKQSCAASTFLDAWFTQEKVINQAVLYARITRACPISTSCVGGVVIYDKVNCRCQTPLPTPAPPTPAPTPRPSPAPTPRPTPRPTPNPTPSPTPNPTPRPTPQPTPNPTPRPTPNPTPNPTPPPPGITLAPTPRPTPSPPTPRPTPAPTPRPTPRPSPAPTPRPTAPPTPAPTPTPPTPAPTPAPTPEPSPMPFVFLPPDEQPRPTEPVTGATVGETTPNESTVVFIVSPPESGSDEIPILYIGLAAGGAGLCLLIMLGLLIACLVGSKKSASPAVAHQPAKEFVVEGNPLFSGHAQNHTNPLFYGQPSAAYPTQSRNPYIVA
jgi:hypothetical protein